jgi:hypothetical protein
MRINYTQQKEICSAFIDGIKKINPKDPALKFWYKELTECQNRAIDCAHKLAPYEHPKLESMEVKQTIEHRMVMRAPQKILDVDQWAKLTGATVAKLEDLQKRETTFAPRTESLHDFDEDESEDEINTQRQLN